MLTTDTTAMVWDTVDTTVDTTDTPTVVTTADTGREKPRLMLSPRLMPLPMPGTDTTDIPDTTADTTDTDTDTMPALTDTTVATGGKPKTSSHLSFRYPIFFAPMNTLAPKLFFSQILIGQLFRKYALKMLGSVQETSNFDS